MPFASYPSEDLNGRWMLAYSDALPQEPLRTIADVENAGMPRIPATVPGNFELDLHAAGTIPEPFFGMNIASLRRFEKTHVWYYRRFSAALPPDHQAVLVFEGLDCFADIYLNGQRIGSGDNMLVEQVFPVGAALQTENELVVHIRPALEEARQYDYPPGLLAEKSGYEALYVRKAPHMYGWDIMPRALSAGMWRPVALRYLPAERLETVYLQTFAADEYQARLVLRFQAHLADLLETHYEIEIEGRCGESQFARRERIGAGPCSRQPRGAER